MMLTTSEAHAALIAVAEKIARDYTAGRVVGDGLRSAGTALARAALQSDPSEEPVVWGDVLDGYITSAELALQAQADAYARQVFGREDPPDAVYA